MALAVKSPPASAGQRDGGLLLPEGTKHPTQHCLETPWTGEPVGYSPRVTESLGQDGSDFPGRRGCLETEMPKIWEKQMGLKNSFILTKMWTATKKKDYILKY